MTKPMIVLVAAGALVVGVGSAALAAHATRHPAATLEASTYDARGVVRSFGPSRAYVNIAHEDIPGYMKAMTMSFEPRTPSQLDGLAVGDHVVFRFTDQGDGRRLIDSIRKQ